MKKEDQIDISEATTGNIIMFLRPTDNMQKRDFYIMSSPRFTCFLWNGHE